MRFKIANPKDYSQSDFHHLISLMLEHNNHDCVVFYKNHVITIVYNREKQLYICKMFELIKDHKNYIDVKKDVVLELTFDCHKYITHNIVHNFIKKIYDLTDDFSMDILEFKFINDVENFVFLEE